LSIELTNRPDRWGSWLRDLASHGDVLWILARKDFHTRYKRASLGIVWAVVVPVLQAAIMAVVFSHVIRTGSGKTFAVYVMGGIFMFTYFSATVIASSTSIVEASSMTDKVWFPRAILVVVPVLSNMVGLLNTVAALIASMPIFGAPIMPRVLLIFPALALLVCLTTSLSLLLSALHVYFRDVKFLVQAAMMIWIYITPIIYPIQLLHHLLWVAEINPLTGVVQLVHLATVGTPGPLLLPLFVTAGATVVLAVAGCQAQRIHDRLFVDLL
jgi:lipopolysaccharide transport system permease protein